VNLDLPREIGRLNADVEIALFRTVQETLTNVHRHSGSSVEIRLNVDERRVRLQVKDDGKGIPLERLRQIKEGSSAGVGIAGMRERVRELGGWLDVQSDQTGTRVIVSIPSTHPSFDKNSKSPPERRAPAA